MIQKGEETSNRWKRIKEVVPSPNAVFHLSDGKVKGEVVLRPEEWRVLTQVNGVNTVEEIAQRVGMNEYDASLIIRDLFFKGLIEAGPQSSLKKKTISPQFFDVLEQTYKEVLGPIAPAIIEEVMEEMKESRGTFPLERVSESVERLSERISTEPKRKRFQERLQGSLRDHYSA